MCFGLHRCVQHNLPPLTPMSLPPPPPPSAAPHTAIDPTRISPLRPPQLLLSLLIVTGWQL